MKKYILLISMLFLFTLGTAYAQETQNPPILDDVMKNNMGVDISEENSINATNGDAIRVAGLAQVGSSVTVYFNNAQYKGVVDENGKWFVLFSVTQPKEQEYSVEAIVSDDNTKSEKVQLFKILIVEEDGTPLVIEEEKKDIDFKIVVIILQSLLILLLVWFLLSPKILKTRKKK